VKLKKNTFLFVSRVKLKNILFQVKKTLLHLFPFPYRFAGHYLNFVLYHKTTVSAVFFVGLIHNLGQYFFGFWTQFSVYFPEPSDNQHNHIYSGLGHLPVLTSSREKKTCAVVVAPLVKSRGKKI
jgi:CRISPR/Cas system CMR-associated protein Cmr3 (group 5 of RAMP superfamily)